MENNKCEHKKIDEKIIETINEYKHDKSNLIQVLNEVQEYVGYIPRNIMQYISEQMQIPFAEVYGVVTFYARFSLKPKGKYNVCVCQGTACYVKGAERILSKVKTELGIELGQTTKDGKFSLEPTRCLGACGLAPVFTVNGEVYGKATVEKVREVLEEYKKK